MWSSLKSVYLEAAKDARIEAYILCIPKKVIGDKQVYSESEVFETQNESYDFFSHSLHSANVINAYNQEDNEWFDLQYLNPDCVFYMRPYENYYPSPYKSCSVRQYSRVCYIPYAYCTFRNTEKSIYNVEFINNVYAVFFENQFYCDMIEKTYKDLFGSTRKRFLSLGFPRFDLYSVDDYSHVSMKKCNTFLWLPRWATGSFTEKTTFFDYKETLVTLFLQNGMCLVCRPHPLMFQNFISQGLMTKKEIDSFLDLFSSEESLIYDDNPDYMQTFSKADAFISDISSLLIEEMITLKPIIFLGNPRKVYGETKKYIKYWYIASNARQLSNYIEMLGQGIDPKYQLRVREIPQLLVSDGKNGERILNYMKAECYNKNV